MLPLQNEPDLGKVTASCGKSEAGFVVCFLLSHAGTDTGCGAVGSADPCACLYPGFQDVPSRSGGGGVPKCVHQGVACPAISLPWAEGNVIA